MSSSAPNSALWSVKAQVMKTGEKSLLFLHHWMLSFQHQLFSDMLPIKVFLQRASVGHATLSRPKSLLVCSPSTKLLSLEEAQARTQAQLASPVSPESKYIEVGEGPAALHGKFHTIIEFPTERCVHLSVLCYCRNEYSVHSKYSTVIMTYSNALIVLAGKTKVCLFHAPSE